MIVSDEALVFLSFHLVSFVSVLSGMFARVGFGLQWNWERCMTKTFDCKVEFRGTEPRAVRRYLYVLGVYLSLFRFVYLSVTKLKWDVRVGG